MTMDPNRGQREYDKFIQAEDGKTAVRSEVSFPGRNQSSFGDNIVVEPTPLAQLSAQYGVPDRAETFTATGGGITVADNMFTLTTGTNIGGYGVLRTASPALYREGQGLSARYTVIFDKDNAVANSLQFGGFFSVQDTLAFGYRGASFGIIYDTYGAQETRTLAITTGGNGNLTLTLNSVAYVIPITTGTIAHNCYEIEAWMDANQSVWNTQQVGDTVVFQNKNTVAAAGTYSISGAGVVGSFSTNATGAAKAETTIAQSSWNGSDISSWFDPSESNVYQIQLSYLGFGPHKFFIMNTSTGKFDLVHTIYNNDRIKPNLSNRALKCGWVAASLGSTTNITVKGASCGIFVDGKVNLLARPISHGNSNANVSTTFVSIISFRVKRTYAGKAMIGRVVPFYLEVSSDSSKETRFKLTKNANLGETAFVSHADDNVMCYDNTARNQSGGDDIYEGTIGPGGSKTVNLKELNIDLLLGETLTVFARVVSGASSDITAALIWKEDI